jgi:hypothetical protein
MKVSEIMTHDVRCVAPPYDPDQPLTAEVSGALHDYYGQPRHVDDEEIGEAIVRNDNPNVP